MQWDNYTNLAVNTLTNGNFRDEELKLTNRAITARFSSSSFYVKNNTETLFI